MTVVFLEEEEEIPAFAGIEKIKTPANFSVANHLRFQRRLESPYPHSN